MEFSNFIHNLFSFDFNNKMILTGGTFLLLFTVFLVIFAFLYQNRLIRTLYIILFSLFFYYKLNGLYFLVLFIPITVDYFAAIKIYESKLKKTKNLWFAISIISNIGLLFYFKYTNFFIESFCTLKGVDFTPLKIIIPLGISFYTFRTISYIIDVYRNEMEPTHDYTDYAFYMTFFPLLISGPITRAKFFLPQLHKRPIVTNKQVSKGLFLIIIGLVKKAVIADYLSQYNDLVFADPGNYTGFENLMAIYGYTAQIYFDFSGYTDIAIGIATIIGFNIGINFNKPYHALNITDFWRRWHISLSLWLRDYLFSPMSLNFRNIGKSGLIIAIVITFIICGIWHEGSLSFIIWGLLNGLILGYEILTAKIRKRIKNKTKPSVYNTLSWIITFHVIVALWIVFRAPTLNDAQLMVHQIFFNMNWAYAIPFFDVRFLFLMMLIIGFAFYAIPAKWFPEITQRFINTPFLIKAIVFIVAAQLIIQFQSADVQPFLYGKF